jgi:serine/threonine protein kinase
MLSTRLPDAEPIPGYRLLSPLGSGGVGEVWKCVAPGGLTKAIKFVRGTGKSLFDGHCPSAGELRSIDRIKDFRHPFLLSMERVERSDDGLVIVMELADRSLEELLQERLSQNQAGLPRDEVLFYLEEAAEVLDLMNFEYGLQHLDVKPRNLFLVRGHVKVADFGLVQSLADYGADGTPELNMVTPLYAAPEVFHNKISSRCDLYSLAIVYQELLTGSRPFSGRNLRQLMLAHSVAEPDLSPLPESDRPVIGKALAKEPSLRFPSCTDLVRALREAEPFTPQVVARAAHPRPHHGSPLRSVAETRNDLAAFSATQPSGPAEGRALPGYQFSRCLHRSPRGETWEARDAESNRRFVHLYYGVGDRLDPDALGQLQSLEHPSLLPLTVSPAGRGSLLVTTGLVERSLRSRWQECVALDQPGIPRPELLDRLGQTAEALDELYRQHGLQHLELNPTRLLLDDDRLLLDQFGVAQLVWLPAGLPPGHLQARYNAPERSQGLVTRSCDQFSLAVIYQEMLTGQHPFRGRSFQGVPTPARGRLEMGPDLARLPAGDQPLVARALSSDPAKRFDTCVDFVRSLRQNAPRRPIPVEWIEPTDPAKADRQKIVLSLLDEARRWMATRQDSGREVASASDPGTLERKLLAVISPGGVTGKLESLGDEWEMRLCEESETRVVLMAGERARSWMPWRVKSLPLRLEICWTRPSAQVYTLPEASIRVSLKDAADRASASLLERLGPPLLESVQTCLLGSPERRVGERHLWPHPVSVAWKRPAPKKPDWLACQAKDLSAAGMGLYMPRALTTSQIQVRLCSPALKEPAVLPANIVRIHRWDDSLFEVGLVFE